MLRNVASKVMWVGRATVFLVGLAVILAVALGVASTAFGADGQPFFLGRPNVASTMSTLIKQGPGAALSLQVASGSPPLAVNSDTRVTNLNADKLDGKSEEAFYAAGSQVADSKLLDGLPSTVFQRRVSGTCPEGSSIRSIGENGIDVTCESDDESAAGLVSTVVVSPVGSATQNGTALKDALAGITDASVDNPYLLKIEPGVYDLGSRQFDRIDMKSFVDVEGSGEGVTTITSSNSSGTVIGAANSELRSATVKHTGGPNGATAILDFTNDFRVTHVTAAASGEGPINYGLNIFGTAMLSQVTATASGASARNTGVNINGTATLDQVTATASGSSGDGSRGVEIGNSSADATAVLSQVTATASGSPSYGVYNSGSTQIHNSRIAGDSVTLYNNFGTMLVGASHLIGPGSTKESGTTLTCAGVYDEDYAFSAGPDCP
jgi:hypothetical protein